MSLNDIIKEISDLFFPEEDKEKEEEKEQKKEKRSSPQRSGYTGENVF